GVRPVWRTFLAFFLGPWAGLGLPGGGQSCDVSPLIPAGGCATNLFPNTQKRFAHFLIRRFVVASAAHTHPPSRSAAVGILPRSCAWRRIGRTWDCQCQLRRESL